MRSLRAALYPLRLVGARLSRRSAPVVLVVLGIAAGASVVLGGRAGALVAQDRAVAQAVERIEDGQRSVRAVWFGVPGQSDEPQPALERRARAALATADAGSATSLVLFRESTIGGTFAGLGGVQELGRWVTLRAGRLPRTCTPERCEVLRLRGEGRLPRLDGIALVEVGEAVLDNRVLFGDFLAPTDNALADAEVSPSLARAAGYHRPPPPPLFLAEGVAALAAAPALERVYRSYAWVAPLAPGRPRLWEVDELAVGGDRSALRAPGDLDQLRSRRAGRGAARRAGDEPRGGAAARRRRRRGGGAPVRVRAARCDDASSRPARRPPPARLVRGARLAARARDRRRVGRTRAGRDGDRARGGADRRRPRRGARRRARRRHPDAQHRLG